MPRRTFCCWCLTLVTAWWFAGPTVVACNVPVFRYALERWRPDRYEAVLFHEGPLSSELQAVVRSWEEADGQGRRLTNLHLRLVNLQEPLDETTQALWKRQEGAQAPWLLLRFPAALQVDRSVWSGRADPAVLAALRDSPVRRELVRRLLAGESTVWLLVEGADAAENDRVAATLERELSALAKTVKLPDETAQPGGVLKLPENLGEGVLSKIPLQIAFSVLRVSRHTAAEQFFLATILQTDEGLAEETGPVVVPIFGRGRALQAFPGAAIDNGTLRSAEDFLCGACSCAVKSQNPGMDLLVAAPWEAELGTVLPIDELPAAEVTFLPIPSGKVGTPAVAAAPTAAPAAGPPVVAASTRTRTESATSPPVSSTHDPVAGAILTVLGGAGLLGVLVLAWVVSR